MSKWSFKKIKMMKKKIIIMAKFIARKLKTKKKK